MENDQRSLFPFVSGMIIGAVIGAGIALTFAPNTGKKTRRQVKKVAGNFREAAEDRWDDAAENVRDRAESVRRRFF